MGGDPIKSYSHLSCCLRHCFTCEVTHHSTGHGFFCSDMSSSASDWEAWPQMIAQQHACDKTMACRYTGAAFRGGEVGGDENRARRRVNIGFAFVMLTLTQLQMDTSAALYLLHACIGNCLLTSLSFQLKQHVSAALKWPKMSQYRFKNLQLKVIKSESSHIMEAPTVAVFKYSIIG